jgi:uncharacterized protein Yka (UPF0111/DUF47 family)
MQSWLLLQSVENKNKMNFIERLKRDYALRVKDLKEDLEKAENPQAIIEEIKKLEKRIEKL